MPTLTDQIAAAQFFNINTRTRCIAVQSENQIKTRCPVRHTNGLLMLKCTENLFRKIKRITLALFKIKYTDKDPDPPSGSGPDLQGDVS
mgnify:CR=1 FL=1